MQDRKIDYSKSIVEAMRAAGLTDATSPLYDLKIPANPVPRTVKLDFSATAPDYVFQSMCAQIYFSGHSSGQDAKSEELRQVIGLG